MKSMEDMISAPHPGEAGMEQRKGPGTMTNRTQLFTVALATIGLALGCAAAAGPASDPFAGAGGEKEIKVFITNLAFMDATVYGVTNGARKRLGRVTGKRESVFSLPLEHASDFYMEIDILAGPKCRTERMNVNPGDHLELIIRTDNPYLFCAES